MNKYELACTNLHLRFPRDFIGLSRGWISGKHYGIDLGWNRNYGGQNAPVYAAGAGEVVAVTDGHDNEYPNGGGGNIVKIKHADGIYTLYAHLLKKSITVKVGQKVSAHQQIAKMGNSGASQGAHLHFELYLGGASTMYRVDPMKYVFAYPDDVLTEKTKTNYTVKYYTPSEPIKYIGTPVEEDRSRTQFRCNDKALRVRDKASTSLVESIPRTMYSLPHW